jgi:hypothetical protein
MLATRKSLEFAQNCLSRGVGCHFKREPTNSPLFRAASMAQSGHPLAKSGQGTFSRLHDVLSKCEMAQTTRIKEEKTMEYIMVVVHELLMSLVAGGTSFSPSFLTQNQGTKSIALLQGSSTQRFLIARSMSFCSSSRALSFPQ